MRALNDNVIIKTMICEKKDSIIQLTQETKARMDPQLYGVVETVGSDVKNVNVGDIIVAPRHCGLDMYFLSTEVYRKVLKETEIVAVLEDDDRDVIDSLTDLEIKL